LKDIYVFYDKKIRLWHDKYSEIQKEYDQYEKLVLSIKQIILKINGIMTKVYEVKEKYKGGDKCYQKYSTGFKAKFESIKTEDNTLLESRKGEEVLRFQTEFLTHKIKHYNKLCEASSSNRFR